MSSSENCFLTSITCFWETQPHLDSGFERNSNAKSPCTYTEDTHGDLTDSWHSYIGISINFHEESGIITFWSNELSAPHDVSKGCEALFPEEVDDYGFL